ncbi:DUF6622 family protein [Piscirickettsia litoralis]|uniref:DUF1453 domain-containing protein n=1 Tax=Piscirickettsia litoralis TaxID=1891921 RepID=A0ABX3A237_9GAMM|nr:DUF6622 family protein [Piscirickettsia litoralis]ODN42934.1 hypothetical protein BGC07_08370 [Piscirickettsia litoralis]
MNAYHTLYLTLSHTPWWAYALLIFFIKRGISALSVSTHSIYRLTIIPTIFTFCSIRTLMTASASQAVSDILILWALGLIAGLMVAYFNTPTSQIHANYSKHTLSLPGSPYTLIFLLGAFTIKYTLFYQLALTPEIIRNFSFNVILLTTAGLFTGLSIGRSLCLSYSYYTKKCLKTSVHS